MTETVYIGPNEEYSMEYEYTFGDVLPVNYYHLGFHIAALPDDIIDQLIAAAYQQEREREVDFGNDEQIGETSWP